MFPSGPNNPQRHRQPKRSLRHDQFLHPAPSNFRKQVQGFRLPENVLAVFKTSEGNLDFDKISGTVQHLTKLYGEVRPMISKFMKR